MQKIFKVTTTKSYNHADNSEVVAQTEREITETRIKLRTIVHLAKFILSIYGWSCLAAGYFPGVVYWLLGKELLRGIDQGLKGRIRTTKIIVLEDGDVVQEYPSGNPKKDLKMIFKVINPFKIRWFDKRKG